MALKGGSTVVAVTATVLSGAIPGVIECRSLTFNCPLTNANPVTIGGSDVDDDGHPGYCTIPPGGSWTPPAPEDGRPFKVDFSKLYAISTAGTEILQIAYVN